MIYWNFANFNIILKHFLRRALELMWVILTSQILYCLLSSRFWQALMLILALLIHKFHLPEIISGVLIVSSLIFN
jgi:hypothetical protein